jgi:hypothetical protein
MKPLNNSLDISKLKNRDREDKSKRKGTYKN